MTSTFKKGDLVRVVTNIPGSGICERLGIYLGYESKHQLFYPHCVFVMQTGKKSKNNKYEVFRSCEVRKV